MTNYNNCYISSSNEPDKAQRVNKNSFETLLKSKQLITNPTTNNAETSLDPNLSQFLVCSGFGNVKKPSIQNPISLKSRELRPLNSCLKIIFKLDENHSLSDIKAQLAILRKYTGKCDYILFPNVHNLHIWYYVLPVNYLLDAKNYRIVIRDLLSSIATKGLVDRPACEDPLTKIPLINTQSILYSSKISYQHTQSTYNVITPPSLAQNLISATKLLISDDNPNNKLYLFKSQLTPNKVEKLREIWKNTNDKEAHQKYLDAKSIIHDRNVIIMSIAKARVNQSTMKIKKTTAEQMISVLDNVDNRHKNRYLKQYKIFCRMLSCHQANGYDIEPLSEALNLFQIVHGAPSIGALFQQLSGISTKRASKMNLTDAFYLIKFIFPPALVNSSNKGNSKNVVIFNPLDGYWSHDTDTFADILRALNPTASIKSVYDLIDSLGSNAATNNRYITGYHGNRYLLYNNGVYDTAQPDNPKTHLPDHLIPLNSNLVHDLHFTKRAYHRINLVVNPPLPKYDALAYKSNNGAMWTPLRVLDGYSNFDKNIRTYFLFCLSLGLFSTHNFSVSLDIQGPSGSGKTMLSTIFETIYGVDRVNMAPFANLNDRFVFTSYADDTAIIWFDEANTDSKPLGSRGISTYDDLNNDKARFEVKNKDDHIIDNPPMVFIDGTDFLKTSNPDIGPYRRTLVMKLPSDLTEEKKHAFYTNDFKDLLSKRDVVEWLNWQMILAYRKGTSVSDRKHDISYSLTEPLVKKKLSKIVPQKAWNWRENLRNHSNNNITEWFTNVLEPCLNHHKEANPDKYASRVEKSFMYNLFVNHMITVYGQRPNNKSSFAIPKFWSSFKTIAEERGWTIIPIRQGGQKLNKSRKKIKTLTGTNINFQKYIQFEDLPSFYKQSQVIKHDPFGFERHWSYIEKVSHKQNN